MADVEIVSIPLAKLILDDEVQQRTHIDPQEVENYAAFMKEDIPFPPIVVFHHEDTYWIADGFHRVHAAQKAGLTELLAEVHTGTKREAILYGHSPK